MRVFASPAVWPVYTSQKICPFFSGGLQFRVPIFAKSQYLKPCRRFSYVLATGRLVVTCFVRKLASFGCRGGVEHPARMAIAINNSGSDFTVPPFV